MKTHEELINQEEDEQSLTRAQQKQKLEAGNWPLKDDSLSLPLTPPCIGHDPEPMDSGRLGPSSTRDQATEITPAKTPNPNCSSSPRAGTPTPGSDTFGDDDLYGTSPPRKPCATTSAPVFEHIGRGLAVTWCDDQNRDIPRPLFSGPSHQRQEHQSSDSDSSSRAKTSPSSPCRPAISTTFPVGSPSELPIPSSNSHIVTHGSVPRHSVADSTTTRLATQTSDTAIRELILPTLVAQGPRVSETIGITKQNVPSSTTPVSSSDPMPPPPSGSKRSGCPKIKEVGERQSNVGSSSASTAQSTSATPSSSDSPTQERQATFITPDPNAGSVSGVSSAFSQNSSSRRSSRSDRPGQSPRQPTFVSPDPDTGVTSTASRNSSVQRSSRIDRDGQSPRQPTFISPDPDTGITSRVSENSSVQRSSRIDVDGREARQPTFIAPTSSATVESPVPRDSNSPRSVEFDPDALENRRPSFLG